MGENPKRRLAAIVAADVAGSSRLVGQDEEATIRALRAHRAELIKPLLSRHGGRIANTAGDSLLIEFPSAVEAVRCAVAVQNAMTGRNRDTPEDRRIEFRIGVHVGDVIAEGDDLLGDGVNVAARLEGLAEPGGICLSRAARDQVRDLVDFAFEDLGEIEVKNIARPVRTFRVLPEGGESPPRPGPARSLKRPLAAAAALIALAGAAWVWQPWVETVAPARPENMAFALPDKPSIAVLAFDYIGADKEGNEYLADGLSENIIAVLSKNPDMFVIARNSTFTLKGTAMDVREVAEMFGVRYVLEGSVQKSGDDLRVTAQLVDGVGGRHLWAETYDRDIADVFSIQDEIASRIAVALQVSLTEGEQAAHRYGTTNLEAWALNLKGNEQISIFLPKPNRNAREYYEAALREDPASAHALAFLALTYFLDIRFGWAANPGEALQEAGETVDRALAIDPEFPEALSVKALVLLLEGRYDEALAYGRKMVSVAPNAAEALAHVAMVEQYAGYPERAIALYDEARRLHPRHHWWYLIQQIVAYRDAEQYQDVLRIAGEIRQLLASRGLAGRAESWIGIEEALAYYHLGNLERAREKVADVVKYSHEAAAKGGYTIATLRHLHRYRDPEKAEAQYEILRQLGLPEKPPSPSTE